MTGDFDAAQTDYKPDYAGAGFASMVNFYFPKRGDLDGIVHTWQAYADSVAAHSHWHPFNYLNNSYHREADTEHMADCATALLLSPGVAQIFYGDETGRKLSDARLNVDSDQAFRSDMDWEDIDHGLLEHYRRLGTIRRAHPVIGTGRQKTIDTHTCARYHEGGDTLVIAVKLRRGQAIPVAGVYPDGTRLTDLYSGAETVVADGKAFLPDSKHPVAVLTR